MSGSTQQLDPLAGEQLAALPVAGHVLLAAAGQGLGVLGCPARRASRAWPRGGRRIRAPWCRARWAGRSCVHLRSVQQPYGHGDVPGPQPLPHRLGLRIEARLRGDALAEEAVDDEVQRPQPGQDVAYDGEPGGLRQQFPEPRDGQLVGEPPPGVVGAGPRRRRWRPRPCRRCGRRAIRPRGAARVGPEGSGSGSSRLRTSSSRRYGPAAGTASRDPSGTTATCSTSPAGTYAASNTPYGAPFPGGAVTWKPG